MKSLVANPNISNPKKFAALVIDLQYDPKIDSLHQPFNPLGFSEAFKRVIAQIERELGISVALVRYGLSSFSPGLIDASGDAPIFTKTKNSALSLESVRRFIADADTLILSGYSCGVCVRETASDAIAASKQVWYSSDTVFSEKFVGELTTLNFFVASLARMNLLGPNVSQFANLSQMETKLRSSLI